MADELNKTTGDNDLSSPLKQEKKTEDNTLSPILEDKTTPVQDTIKKGIPLTGLLVEEAVTNNNITEEEDPLASFFAEETVETKADDDDDILDSFFAEEAVTTTTTDEEDPLNAFFAEETVENKTINTADDDDILDSFFADEAVKTTTVEEDPLDAFFKEEAVTTNGKEDDYLLDSFFSGSDNINTKKTTTADQTGFFFGGNNLDGNDDDENDYKPFGVLGEIVSASPIKPEPSLPYKREKRKARVDITRNSKEDQRTVERYTKKEMEDQLILDYKYMLSKPYMMIQPVTIMADYPYKKKKNDSDIIDDNNVDYDYVINIGKLLKWRSTEEFRRKPYKLGEIMYVKRGVYWVDGNEIKMEPHFAIILHRSYKRIKSRQIRDLFMPIKQRLRSGKPFSIYKEFPIIVKRTAAYS